MTRRWGPIDLALGVVLLVLTLLTIAVLAVGPGLVPDGLLPAKKATAEEKSLLAYRDASRAAEEWTAEFLHVDYKDMDTIFKRVLAGTAAPFRTEYQRSEVNLQQLARMNRSLSTGRVRSVGVSELQGDRATLFVAADSRVQNKSTPKPQTRYYRIKLQMVRDNGRWLVSNLTFVG